MNSLYKHTPNEIQKIVLDLLYGNDRLVVSDKDEIWEIVENIKIPKRVTPTSNVYLVMGRRQGLSTLLQMLALQELRTETDSQVVFMTPTVSLAQCSKDKLRDFSQDERLNKRITYCTNPHQLKGVSRHHCRKLYVDMADMYTEGKYKEILERSYALQTRMVVGVQAPHLPEYMKPTENDLVIYVPFDRPYTY